MRTCSIEKKNKASIQAGTTCSKVTIEVPEQGTEYVQSQEERA